MVPRNVNGKVCYLEIPATDVGKSAAFYRAAFGWEIRKRGDGATAFDDGVEVSGAFVTGRPPSPEAGLLFYVMVADIETTLRTATANGGVVVQPPDHAARDVVARVHDPGGNLIGVYQERALAGEAQPV
jgi:predicted enzyme related to lactoylglutathione lyase